MGKHPLVSPLMNTGIHNLRPPQPLRYVTIWNVDVVVEYFKSMGQNNALSLKQLSQKLALVPINGIGGGQKSVKAPSSRLEIPFLPARRSGFSITNPRQEEGCRSST